jgi:hypothetical protein
VPAGTHNPCGSRRTVRDEGVGSGEQPCQSANPTQWRYDGLVASTTAGARGACRYAILHRSADCRRPRLRRVADGLHNLHNLCGHAESHVK